MIELKKDNVVNKRRSCAEAHIYVAVIKADTIVSHKEVAEASFHARKSQKWMNVLNVNDGIAGIIVEQIQQILRNRDYVHWNGQDHLDYALKLLSELKQSGDWAVKLLFDKMEAGLTKVALADGYDIRESKFLKMVLSRLEELKEGD